MDPMSALGMFAAAQSTLPRHHYRARVSLLKPGHHGGARARLQTPLCWFVKLCELREILHQHDPLGVSPALLRFEAVATRVCTSVHNAWCAPGHTRSIASLWSHTVMLLKSISSGSKRYLDEPHDCRRNTSRVILPTLLILRTPEPLEWR